METTCCLINHVVSEFCANEDLHSLLCTLVCVSGRNGVKGKVELSDHTRTMFGNGYPLEFLQSLVTKGYGYLKDFL